MAAAPARIFSFSSMDHLDLRLLQAASPAAGNGRRGGHPRGGSIHTSLAPKTLLPTDFDIQEGLTNVQKIMQQRRKSGQEMVGAIDDLKRLCIDHYFEEEIEGAMGACMDLVNSDDLFDATLAFRLMRERPAIMFQQMTFSGGLPLVTASLT
ncbi:unnamed protein product [Urochloa humidicola]